MIRCVGLGFALSEGTAVASDLSGFDGLRNIGVGVRRLRSAPTDVWLTTGTPGPCVVRG